MNDAWTDFDDSGAQANDGTPPGPAALRDALKAQKADNKLLMERLEKLEATTSRQTVESVLSTHGIPTSVVEQYKGEATPEKVNEWVTQMRTAFGGAPASTDASPTPVLDAATQTEYANITQAGSTGIPLTTFEGATTGVASATDMQGLINAMKAAKAAG